MGDAPEDQASEDPAPTGSSAETAALEQLKAFAAATDKVRSRTDVAAKTLGALGTTGVSAIGIAKVADVFPYEGPCIGLAALLAGFTAMAFSVVALAVRLWRTQQPIVMRSDRDAMDDLKGDKEKLLVEAVYADTTVLNNVPTLLVYEARGHRFERIAQWTDEKQAKALLDRAALISAEIGATQARAALMVIRRRAAEAITGIKSCLLYALFFSGLLAFAMGSDSLEGNRSGELSLAKSCAEAQAAGVTTLPESCGDTVSPSNTDSDTKSAAQAAAEAVAALAAARADCLSAREQGTETTVDPCESLERALDAAVSKEE